ncbi:MAG: Cys-tRNA(Pro) deacylase [Spirochaetaceae bacterium]|nr:Cys-tRNA(Pro) deacylase [Spirochaetaceae bacterium]
MNKDKGIEKTNAVRHLESMGLAFEVRHYKVDEEDLSAKHAAQVLGMDPDQVFKTIVLRGERTGYFVCVLPGSCEIDLKKAARAAGDKSCTLLPLAELEPLTGYIRGGCSPLGMKKKFPTFIDETAMLFDRISVSAGKRGLQLLISPEDLKNATEAGMADLIA